MPNVPSTVGMKVRVPTGQGKPGKPGKMELVRESQGKVRELYFQKSVGILKVHSTDSCDSPTLRAFGIWTVILTDVGYQQSAFGMFDVANFSCF